jgi:DNA-binding transcriptional regulator YhcF (GntR family)
VRGGNGRSQPTQSLGREASPASCSSFGCRSSPSNRHLAFFESVERGAASVRLVKTSRSEQAYAALKRQILDQDLQPGARLNIDALSRLLGVSSSPLREAMVRLEVEGLVVFTTNTGFSVAPLPDADQMRQLFEFRLLIETHCVRLGAARGEADDVAALTQATDAMAKMRRAGVGYEGYDAYFTPEQRSTSALWKARETVRLPRPFEGSTSSSTSLAAPSCVRVGASAGAPRDHQGRCCL